MRFRALACDYDGTLATNSVVDPQTINSLRRWTAAGRKLLLVTGRELPELKVVLPELAIFDYVVAENGALLYLPATDKVHMVATPPPPEFIAELAARGVGPISVGHSIVATWQPHENTVLETIKDMGLELQVIFNKGAVMILPSGVNKATGLAAALKVMELSRHAVVAVGDAENDHAFLHHCRLGVAVENALPALKQRAEWITPSDHGRGVQELIDRLLSDELRDIPTPLRHRIELRDAEHTWSPGEEHLLLAADEASYTAAALLVAQKLSSKRYQHIRFDCRAPGNPASSGAPTEATNETTVGTSEQLPTVEEVASLLARPHQSAHVILCAHSADDQRQRFSEIWRRVEMLRQERGHPHCVILPSPTDCKKLRVEAASLLASFPSAVLCYDRTQPLPTTKQPHHLFDFRDWQSTPPVISTL